MEDLLQDFLVEANDLLSSVDNKLVELEKNPQDHGLLNDIFRGFHTIKGGAGFLNATELVTLCHLTENLFDRLRNDDLTLTREAMDVIMEATAGVRTMFGALEGGQQPGAAPASLLGMLKDAIAGKLTGGGVAVAAEPAESADSATAAVAVVTAAEPDWGGLLEAVIGAPVPATSQAQSPAQAAPAAVSAPAPAPKAASAAALVVAAEKPAVSGGAEKIIQQAVGRRASDKPGYQSAPVGRRDGEKVRDNSIRVDTARLDHVLNLSGEIGLTKNRLNSLRSEILAGRSDSDTMAALDQAVSQLDLLVSDLQSAVMKTRMQPVGRLFQKYPRIARDLARSLGKDVELVLAGEDTEIDKTMIEDLSDPIVHLIRNAVDHGVESPADRVANGKPEQSVVRLEARQEGDHIVILVSDDGRGMSPDRLRAKAFEKGLITEEEANAMDDRQSYNLIFLPGFSTNDVASDVSGRGVGMDVVRTNIHRLNGHIDIKTAVGEGTTFVISLPLTLAILPVLLVELGEQPFAVPLTMVREILPIRPEHIQEVGGGAVMIVRGEVLPVMPLATLLGWPMEQVPEYGVLMQTVDSSFILAIDGFAGREDAVIKSLEDFRPKGVAGVTTLSNGQIVLILDMKELLGSRSESGAVTRTVFIARSGAAAA
ncbi:MAG: chemotaxis protein CheA [Sterolibacterium sp.]|nr:chemotaxis protein CheA [Sterolibacterium sp.]MBP9799846.1 chemotaxis protein CheA [Sterolibacterium sp.]